MAAFATCLEEALSRRAGTRLHRWLGNLAGFVSGRRPLDLNRTVLVCTYHPTAKLLERLLGGVPRHVALPFPPAEPLPGVRYFPLRADVNPLDWGKDLDGCIPRDVDTVASLLTWDQVFWRTLVHWSRLGIRRCWFLREPAPVGIPPRWGAAGRLAQAVRRRWRQRREAAAPPAEVSVETCRHVLNRLGSSPAVPRLSNSLRITHYAGSLYSGGAERQLATWPLCSTARALRLAS